jgi:putative transposase
MQLTEQIQLKSTPELSILCHETKNLYNEANFQYRQFHFNLDEFINYYDLQVILKEYDCYKSLPAQTAQQTLKLLIQNWKSYWSALKEYKIHPEKFLGCPRPPKYKEKNGESICIFTNQNTHLKDGFIHFPKSCNLQPIKTRLFNYQQIRIIPQGYGYICEIVYNYAETDLGLNHDHCIGIDLGLNNLATIVNNIGIKPIVIKGGIIKSDNQFYNKVNAFLQSNKDKQHYEFQTKKQQRLLKKRNNQIRDTFHQASRWIVNYCIQNDIGTIVIGYNPEWKQEIELGKRNNQQFVQIPFVKLIQQIEYKAKMVGIQVITHEESYTSKCSFLDNESIEKHDPYAGKRLRSITINHQKMKCNLFRRGNGQRINGDVNGALNILRKATSNECAEKWEGLVLSPLSVRFNRNFIRKPIKSA